METHLAGKDTDDFIPVSISLGARPEGPASTPDLLIDPVCKMIVTAKNAADKTHWHGDDYYFCATACSIKFSRQPAYYAASLANLGLETTDHTEASPPVTQDDTIDDTEQPAGYTCPMHPEIIEKTNVPCPLCGMALDPMDPYAAMPSAATDKNSDELSEMRHRMWLSLAASAPLMAEHAYMSWTGQHQAVIPPVASALLATWSLWCGKPILVRFWESLKSGHSNMFTLIGSGVLLAYGFSAFLMASGKEHQMLFWESCASIITLTLLGQVLELKARKKTGAAIQDLMSLTPSHAHFVKIDDGEIDIDVSKIAKGDRIRVKAGESAPCDGLLLSEECSIDESMLSGESMPQDKKISDTIYGGTINSGIAFLMRATQVGRRTRVAQIVRLVAQAQRSQAPVQRLADLVAGYFVPAVTLVAVATFCAWYFWQAPGDIGKALSFAVSVLIIACPCALGLATPMSVTVAMGRGARQGLLIKDAAALQKLSKVDTLIVDKTGTITQGKPTVIEVVSHTPTYTPDDLLRLAASIETHSEHILARAIVDAARKKNLCLSPVSDLAMQVGNDIAGTVQNHHIKIGRPKTPSSTLHQTATPIEISQVKDGTEVLLGTIYVADEIRSTSPTAIARLRKRGLSISMATGDAQGPALEIGQKIGLPAQDIVYGALPETKHRLIEDLRAFKPTKKIVAMIGDGINDAPALALADVGIAMGGSGLDSAIALESADIVLLRSDLMLVDQAIELSHDLDANIKQNLALAFAYNLLAVPLAAGTLYPAFGLAMTPAAASLAMALSSVCVIGNALRLRR